MTKPVTADVSKSISSENLAYSSNQNPEFGLLQNHKQKLNQTQYYSEGSQSINKKQVKLIQLLICVRLLEMGLDWRTNIQQIQAKMQQNRYIAIEDVPRILNQLVPSFISIKNTNKDKNILIYPQIQQEKELRIDSEFQFLENNVGKTLGHQIILIGKQLKLCPICFQQTYQCIKLPCSHIFCKQCIKRTIQHNFNNGTYDVICPDYECGISMPDDILQKILEKDIFSKLKYFQAKQALQANPHNKFCSIPDCGQLLISVSNYLECKKCQKQYCRYCLQQKHQKNCDQQLLKKLKILYDSHQVKKCPKCKSPIQKDDGCNHMTCTKCKFSFCWICLSQYTDHHYRYYNFFGCPGMQFQDQNEIATQRIKQACFFLFFPFLLLLLIICLILCYPAYIIIVFFLKPCSWASQYKNMCQTKLILDKICCCNCQDSLKTVIAYFILLPRSLLYAIFVAPFYVIYFLFHEILGSMY